MPASGKALRLRRFEIEPGWPNSYSHTTDNNTICQLKNIQKTLSETAEENKKLLQSDSCKEFTEQL